MCVCAGCSICPQGDIILWALTWHHGLATPHRCLPAACVVVACGACLMCGKVVVRLGRAVVPTEKVLHVDGSSRGPGFLGPQCSSVRHVRSLPDCAYAACALRSCVGVGTATTQACGICVPGICVPVAKRIHDNALWRPTEAVEAVVGSCSVLQWPPGGLFGAYYRFGADLSIALLWTSTSGAYCSVGTGCGAYCSVGTGSCGVLGATVFVSACA